MIKDEEVESAIEGDEPTSVGDEHNIEDESEGYEIR